MVKKFEVDGVKFVIDEMDEDNIPELIEEVIDAEPDVVEQKVTEQDELRVAKELTGYPHPFDAASVRVLEVLQQRGIAALFEEGWARGSGWKNFVRHG